MLGEQILGVMAVQSYTRAHEYDEHDRDLLTAIANQAAIAIQNARLFEQTRASEARFRGVAHISADYVWEADLEWRYTYFSERVRDILGYDPQELIGKTDYDLTDAGEAEREVNVLEELIATQGQFTDFENYLYAKDGRKVTVLTSAVPILDASGKTTGYRGVDKDITERKRAENIQETIRTIAEEALAAPDVSALLSTVHAAIGRLMPARNFYVSLYDANTDLMTFPYYVDEYDQPMPPQKPGRGLTSHVLRTGRPLLATPEVYKELTESGQVEGGGTPSVDWLGVPLRSGGRVIGVLAVQSYEPQVRLTERDRDTLAFVANQVAVALERKQSEMELRALFASMTDVIIVYDKEGRYVRIAPTSPSRLIRPPDELLGRKVNEVLPLELHEPFMQAIHTTLMSGETTKLEYPLTIGGQTFWFDASISKLGEDQVFWVARDISERRKFEEMLRRQNKYLATSAEIGRLVTSTLDLDTLFTRTVSLICERFGYYHAAIFIVEEAGFHALLEAATGEAGREMKNRRHALAVGSRSIVGTVTSTGHPLVVNDTAIDPIHRPNPLLPETRAETAIPLRIGDRIIGAIDIQSTTAGAFVTDDVAVLQILADQVATAIDNARSYQIAQQAIHEMSELDRLKSQFLANMSHELRTPLNSIIGFSRVILKGIDGPVSELQEQDLNAIYNSGQHLLHLINDILDLSKIEAGKMELSFEEVNVADMVASVIPTVAGLIKGKPIQIVRNIAPDLPVIHADAMRLRQVMLNLLSNAAKFTEEGKIAITAGMESGAQGQPELVIKVTDSGPGISPEDQKKLFQPFSQVDTSPARKTGGSGLGLSICRRLVELHNGRIGVESAVGQGSTFYFTLPIPRVRGAPAEAGGKKTILVIDDSPAELRLIGKVLNERSSYQVILAEGGRQGWEALTSSLPDALILDLFMSGVDGFTLLDRMQNAPALSGIPVVVISRGRLSANQKERFAAFGQHLIEDEKPAEEALLAALEKALERAKPQ
jgi:PAS domain S-box-containing protein